MKNLMYYLAISLLATTTLISGCSDDDNNELPKIDGYNNSDEVASSNLLAHWSFDDTNNERLSSTAPSNTFGTVGFTDGQIGRALKLTQGVLVYPELDNLSDEDALGNFTVSMWVNVTNNKGTDHAGFTSFFSLIPEDVSDVWGSINACAETAPHLPSSDTLKLKNLLVSHAETGNITQDNLAVKNGDKGADFMGAKRWVHYVMTWDGSTNTYKIYGDAASVGGYDDRSATGELILFTPVHPVFGSLASSDIGFESANPQQSWNPWATASIDDVRVFNTVLSQAEITALYNLGKAGR